MIVRKYKLFGAASRCLGEQAQRVSRTEQRRHRHTIPKLPHNEQLASNGVPGLYSKGAFITAWSQQMYMLIHKLNALTANTPEENKTPKDLLIQFARDPNNAALFNYASMAHNLHFHFESLSPYANALASTTRPLPEPLEQEILKDFSSVDDLRQTMIDTADGMFGPGYVWLVRAKVPNTGAPPGSPSEAYRLRILCTYLAGSPYAGAHYRSQSLDMNTQNTNTYKEAAARGLSSLDFQRQYNLQSGAGAFGAASAYGQQQKKVSKGGVEVEPLLCVSTWEHQYLRDHGSWAATEDGQGMPGKRRYLERWWRAVDWDVVWRRCEESVNAEKRSQPRPFASRQQFSHSAY